MHMSILAATGIMVCGLASSASSQALSGDLPPRPKVAATAATTAPAKPIRRAIVRVVDVAPGALRLRVLDPTTRKPVAGRAIVLLRRGKKNVEVAKLRTATDGTCAMPVLADGAFSLDLGGATRLDLRVVKNASIRQLDIILPLPQNPQNPATVPAAPGGAAKPYPPLSGSGSAAGGAAAAGGATASPVAAAGLGTVGWSMVGVGAAATVGGAVVVENENDDNSTNTVSPTSARHR